MSVPTLETTRAAALLAALLGPLGVAGMGAAAGCSLVVESQDRQCESDADCRGFDGGVCDVAGGVCVRRDAVGSTSSASSGGGGGGAGGGGCVGEDGCFACAPSAQAEFLNACTDAACVPYDNAQIEDLLLEDGSLPPVPAP